MKSLGYVGFSDALGEAFFVEIEKAAKAHNIALVASERFAPKDTSVLGQALKLIAAKPDAVVIGASGTPAALPATTLTERGYKGKLYFNHGVANNDFLRVGGKDVEGAFVPASPVIVASQLPDGHPAKKRALEYTALYEAAQGAGSVSAFGSYTWDACLELANAIPVALKSAQPGTVEFRRALRDALEGTQNLEVSNGAVNMSQDQPPRPRLARPRDGADPRWQVGAAAVTASAEQREHRFFQPLHRHEQHESAR